MIHLNYLTDKEKMVEKVVRYTSGKDYSNNEQIALIFINS